MSSASGFYRPPEGGGAACNPPMFHGASPSRRHLTPRTMTCFGGPHGYSPKVITGANPERDPGISRKESK